MRARQGTQTSTVYPHKKTSKSVTLLVRTNFQEKSLWIECPANHLARLTSIRFGAGKCTSTTHSTEP
uniref:Uncharacterized protein n=1 Tax=Triticum urartu TaxID=4572 RepID=A0A8R7NZM8_TRIUA